MRIARTIGFVVLCVAAAAALGVPALKAQRALTSISRPRDARVVAQDKIAPRVLSEIYRRRGDARHKTLAADRARVAVDRHGRVLVDVRADVKSSLEKKIKALGGVVVRTSAPSRSIIGWMPLLMLERLAADPAIATIDLASH